MFTKILKAVKSLFVTKSKEVVKNKKVESVVIGSAKGECETIELIANMVDGEIFNYCIRTIGNYTKSSTITTRYHAVSAYGYFDAMSSMYNAK